MLNYESIAFIKNPKTGLVDIKIKFSKHSYMSFSETNEEVNKMFLCGLFTSEKLKEIRQDLAELKR
jgi:hypothetical protein